MLLGLAFSNSYAAGRQTRSATAAGSSARTSLMRTAITSLIEAACRHQVGQEVGAENEGEGEAGEAMEHEEAQ